MLDDSPATLSRPATPTTMGHTDSRGKVKSQEDVSSERLNLILGKMVTQFLITHSLNCDLVTLVYRVSDQGSVWSSFAPHTLRTKWRTSRPVSELCRHCLMSLGPVLRLEMIR